MMKNNEAVLKLTFALVESVSFFVNEGKVVIVEEQNHWIQRVFRYLKFKIPKERYIELDPYASFVFLQIDGDKTVGEIGQVIEQQYGEAAHPLYERLLLFLNHLEVNVKYIKKIQC